MSFSVSIPGKTPAEFAEAAPSRPVLTSEGREWRDLTLQRYKHGPNIQTIPPMYCHRFSLHLAGPMLIENTCDGCWVRHWSDSGQSYIRPAGVSVTRSHKGRPDYISVHIAPALVDQAAAEAFDRDPACFTLIERCGVIDPALDQLGRLLLAEAEATSSGSRLMAETLATALAVQLLRCHSNLAQQTPGRPAGLPGGRLKRVVEHMRSHLDEDLSLAQLAAVSGLSFTQFARAFRAATGDPPYRYLVRLRIERARELLEHTGLSVIDIGLQCGFEQPTHFANAFRKATGLSPRAWRAMRRV